MVSCRVCGYDLPEECKCPISHDEKCAVFIDNLLDLVIAIKGVLREGKKLYIRNAGKIKKSKIKIKPPEEIVVDIFIPPEDVKKIACPWFDLVDWDGKVLCRKNLIDCLGDLYEKALELDLGINFSWKINIL